MKIIINTLIITLFGFYCNAQQGAINIKQDERIPKLLEIYKSAEENSEYYQLQVYMHLTGCKKAVLTYVLLNTPEELTYEEKHNYDSLDKKYRIKTFEIEYSSEVIAELIKRVINVREYITQL